MKFYRVTEFVRLKEKEPFINYSVIRGMEDGKRLHQALLEVWKDKGWILEQQQTVFFYNLKTKRIIGGLLGTPDMLKIKDGTLFVVDHKSTNYTNNIDNIPNKNYWNQLFLYAG